MGLVSSIYGVGGSSQILPMDPESVGVSPGGGPCGLAMSGSMVGGLLVGPSYGAGQSSLDGCLILHSL